MSQEEIIEKLVGALGETQTLLALIANDPTDPENGERAAYRFNINKVALATAEMDEDV
jgi:hypothetical protein